ncbi:S8 family serine peptidase [bacterium]|nr:S8 family serine peptidase [bacterium]
MFVTIDNRLHKFLIIIFALAMAVPAIAIYGEDPVISQNFELDLELANPEEDIDCIVIMKNVTRDKSGDEALSIPERINLYRRLAFESQEPLIRELRNELGTEIKIGEQFWVKNSFRLTGKPRTIKRIARKKDIKKISRNGGIRMFDGSPVQLSGPPPAGIPANILQVASQSCWDVGVNGRNIIIGHTDTGVDYDHPALSNSFSGYWFDAINGEPRPYDDHGHGTHTIGTVLGGDGNGSFPYDIGVAPEAKWVGVKVMNQDGKGTYEECLKGLQFLAELKAEVDIKIVLGSWSVDNRKEDLFYDISKTFLSLDMLPIFAVGNSGPTVGTAEVPANYPTVLAVGAVDQNNQVASFSSRGPAPDLEAWNISEFWLDTAWQFTKPDMSAPGVAVLSSTLDDSYALWNGSSMAAPHVAGAAALLISHDRSLSPRDVYDLLAIGAGNNFMPDNEVGWGVINIWDSLLLLDPSLRGKSEPQPGNKKSATVIRARAEAGKGSLGSLGSSGNIRFALPATNEISIGIYDLAGRLVKTLPGGTYTSGVHSIYWNGYDNSGRRSNAGVYFVRLSGVDMNLTGKLVLMH